VVAVGYPEMDVSATHPQAYNSLVFVNSTGDIIAHTRKTFLYYTDETWASEGQGFFAGELPLGLSSKATNIAAGICMDLNPYKFEAPWTSYEFANHALASRAEVVVLSMAWLTRLSAVELHERAKEPDLDTLSYWLERLRPFGGPNGPDEEVIVVFANRCGEEGESPLIGPVRYAGSSTVIGVSRGDGRVEGDVRIWDILGRAEEKVLVVDTENDAKYGLTRSLLAERLNEGNDLVSPVHG
jgi:protein N-terminal amidase